MILNRRAEDFFVQLYWGAGLRARFGISSHAHYLASLTSTTPFLGPGTAPAIPITRSSGSTRATVSRLVVTLTWPICPAIFLPGNIRCGYIEPIDPGRR